MFACACVLSSIASLWSCTAQQSWAFLQSRVCGGLCFRGMYSAHQQMLQQRPSEGLPGHVGIATCNAMAVQHPLHTAFAMV